MALNGPNFYEQRRYLQHAIANQKDLKEVILGADFFMFNEFLNNQASFSENRLGKQYLTPEDAINSIFSWDAFSASQETISDSQKNPKDDVNYGRNGFFPVRDIDKKITEWRFEAGLNLYLELHSNYQLSDKYLADFKSFVELCKQKGITLKVFISPAHATDLEAIRTTGQWQTFEQWKRDIVQIVPVWDFSGYNSVTTEPISNHMINYVDNSHYTPKIGDLVLNRVLSYQDETVPKDFGILLTPENVESHIAKIRADREVWANKNPDEVKLVKDIKQEYDAKQALAPK
ncbi:MAG TPA: hypothetical protein DDZ80_08585 [Cyanobacteria bacterium UBA8803]|nr:hypothetical protein [Cyanobacteria bacterium UBA9273]HBL58557.1 hypothetical protein [Cyanobacteria bacterium UBA8803]